MQVRKYNFKYIKKSIEIHCKYTIDFQVGRANKGLKRQIGNWAKKTGLKRNRTRIEQNRRQASGMFQENTTLETSFIVKIKLSK